MKVHVGVFCIRRYNHFKDCLKSLDRNESVKVYAVPMDATAMDIASRSQKHIDAVIYQNPYKSVYGNYRAFADEISKTPIEPTDLIYFSADDYLYRQGWAKKLMDFMSDNMMNISHLSGDLEPHFPWNDIIEMVGNNAVRGYSRATICGANMIMTKRRWDKLYEVWQSIEHDPMLDHRLCKIATDNGKKLIALNLADHTGTHDSSTGNKSWDRPDCIPLTAEEANI